MPDRVALDGITATKPVVIPITCSAQGSDHLGTARYPVGGPALFTAALSGDRLRGFEGGLVPGATVPDATWR